MMRQLCVKLNVINTDKTKQRTGFTMLVSSGASLLVRIVKERIPLKYFAFDNLLMVMDLCSCGRLLSVKAA